MCLFCALPFLTHLVICQTKIPHCGETRELILAIRYAVTLVRGSGCNSID